VNLATKGKNCPCWGQLHFSREGAKTQRTANCILDRIYRMGNRECTHMDANGGGPKVRRRRWWAGRWCGPGRRVCPRSHTKAHQERLMPRLDRPPGLARLSRRRGPGDLSPSCVFVDDPPAGWQPKPGETAHAAVARDHPLRLRGEPCLQGQGRPRENRPRDTRLPTPSRSTRRCCVRGLQNHPCLFCME